MANGNNRAKLRRKAGEIKEAISPNTSPPPLVDVDHDGLLDDLLAQIDGKPAAELEAAKVISSVEANDRAEKAKKDPKKKFLERQVCLFLAIKKTQVYGRLNLRPRKPQLSPLARAQMIQ